MKKAKYCHNKIPKELKRKKEELIKFYKNIINGLEK